MIATNFVKGYLIYGLRCHVAHIPSWHLVMSSIQDTEVDLNKPLSRLYVPYDDLIVLFEANHYL